MFWIRRRRGIRERSAYMAAPAWIGTCFATAIALLPSACDFPGPDMHVAIQQVMRDQEKVWNRGDIPGFMIGYSDTICFIGSKGRTCGKESVTANYLHSYPDAGAMGLLHFDIDERLPIGALNAWVTGRWTLHRSADTLAGGFTLLWAKEGSDWRIVRDHSY